ncbi:Single-stranded DNA-binding replication protein A (RPA), large (70 kD) subunit or related ssDNA-binding protein [Halanaeroarchaeum sp. HSR-CO]|uniref:replication factor A n=1 Tax=Halanaeroarchaeum sp. HSR-CO TaxID=2866382 RepID=UPI00217D8FFB|nr:replication factor A [Halanaeroarchaeum sp. HSR-CO]UWG46528.1 Single-stranded DNA-binding replication protein A (RPA), large (70 kD) subunit or related ssDNA-binding protein [Halanaeroarchaeum sp. HSR-CO]
MSDVHDTAESIYEQFSDHLEVSVEDVEGRLERLVTDYKVPLSEARRSVENHYLDEAGLDRDDLGRGSDTDVTVEEIDQEEQWVNVTVKVVDLWDARSDAVGQVGLVGDETGTIKFTAWAKSDLPSLEDGAVYRLENVVTDEYQGRYSIKLNRTTTITELEEDIEVGDNESEIEGALVDIQSGSGLIKRCPEEGCTRVLQNGRCSEHGEVDGEFDLRIKAVVDDGQSVQEVIFDREATEDLTDIELESAKDMAKDALDTTVVVDEMAEAILGRYYRIQGPTMGRYVLANEVEEIGVEADPEAVLIKARSM